MRRSAGLIPYRLAGGQVEVLIGHMGGPLWARREQGAWTILKGEHDEHEPALDAARREFAEETGQAAPGGETIELGEVRQSGGKRVRAWAVRADLDARSLKSNTFTMQWPPRSGRLAEFPEIDRYQWCGLARAGELLVAGQRPLLERLAAHLAAA